MKKYITMMFLIVAIGASAQKNQAAKPIVLKNQAFAKTYVISGESISGGSVPCIQLINCSNVRITHCQLQNSISDGIQLQGCSNIQVDSNYIAKVRTGVNAMNCAKGSIRVDYNSMLNMQGPYPGGQFVQFNNVGGPYNRIRYNKLENLPGQSDPEDAISIYKSNGLPADPIYIASNQIRGGGPSKNGAGITLGDQGGSYQLAQNNICINTGSMGMQVAGGTYIQISNNKIFGTVFPWSHLGLGCGNYSGKQSANITISGNQVNWVSGNPVDQWKGSKSMQKDTSHQKGTPEPIGWKTNVVKAKLTSSLLPATLIKLQ